MKRREFVKTGAAIGLSQVGFPFLSQAYANGESWDHYFVLVRISGGWDVSLGLDPMSHEVEGTTQKDIFLEYSPDEILSYNNLKLGPACKSLQKYMGQIHAIKGIEMRRDAGHQSNLDIISCGFGDGQTALFPVELAMTTAMGPLGVLIQRAIPTGSRNPILTEISSLENSSSGGDLMDLLTKGNSSTFGNAVISAKEAAKKQKEITAIKKGLSEKGLSNEEFKSVVAAFKSKASFQASIEMNQFNLDTHSEHEGNHLQGLTGGFDQVAELFDYFKSVEYSDGVSLFDKTTFMVVSEFARTPALNGSKGKDHNAHANAVMLAGRGVNGGESTGKTFVISPEEAESGIAEHISHALDFKTGKIVKSENEINENVNLIFPEDVTQTIGHIYGDPKGFYGIKNSGHVIPGILN